VAVACVRGGGRRAEGGGRRGEGLAEGKGEVGVRDLPLRLFTQGNCDPEGEARAAPTAAASDKAPSPSGKTRLLASACARGLEAARKRALSLPRERCSHPLEQRPVPLCLRRKEVAKVVRRDELEPGHTHRSEVSRLHRPARDGGLLRLCCRYRYSCCCHCCCTAIAAATIAAATIAAAIVAAPLLLLPLLLLPLLLMPLLLLLLLLHQYCCLQYC